MPNARQILPVRLLKFHIGMENLVHNICIFNEPVFAILVSLVYYYSLYYYFELVFILGFNFR